MNSGPITKGLLLSLLAVAGVWFGWAVLGHILLTMLALMALNMRIWPRFFFVDIGFLMLLIVLGVRQVCVLAGRLIGRLIGRPGWVDGGFAVAAVAMVALSALFLSILTNAMNLLKINSKIQTIFMGIIVVAAVALDELAKRRNQDARER